MPERSDYDRYAELTNEERAKLAAREAEFIKYQELMERRQREFDISRARLKEEQIARERDLQKEMEAREKVFAEREQKLMARQRSFEEMLMQRQAEADALRNHLQQVVAQREAELEKARLELQQEKERYSEESRRKIERTSKDYVADALDTLDKKERQFHVISRIWGVVGASALVAAIGFFGYVSLSTAYSLPYPMTWEFLLFSIFKGLVAIALLAGLAKYSFLFSSSYMQEALKNADRRHAINFGKFYLESYGAAADWTQVKEAFEHWNIAGANAFMRSEPGSAIDLTALDKAVSLFEKASRSLPKSGKADAAA